MKTFSELISLVEIIYDDLEHGKTVQAAERLKSLQDDAFKQGLESDPPPVETCPRCGNGIDPEACYCGEPIKGGCHDNHIPIPIGCTCHFPKEESEKPPFE